MIPESLIYELNSVIQSKGYAFVIDKISFVSTDNFQLLDDCKYPCKKYITIDGIDVCVQREREC